MDNTQKTAILAHLTALAADEESPLGSSDFAPWQFTDLKFRAGKYTLSFKNEAGTDKVEVPFGDAPVAGSTVAPAFATAILGALRKWEAIESGEDDEDDEDEDEDDDDDE